MSHEETRLSLEPRMRIPRISSERIDRATFLKQAGMLCGVAFIGAARVPHGANASASELEHPDPRPGITAERVLADDALGSHSKDVLSAYAAARAYPEIFDGLGCGCGCTGKDAMHRSLLACYE